MKSLYSLAASVLMALTAFAGKEAIPTPPTPQRGNPPTVVQIIPVDWRQFTNRTGMIKYALGQVRQIVVIAEVPNSSRGREVSRIDYTNTVPTFESMKSLAESQEFSFDVPSEQMLQVTVKFRDDSYYNDFDENNGEEDRGLLFMGSNTLRPTTQKGGGLVADADISMWLAPVIPVKVAGVNSARYVWYPPTNEPWNMPKSQELQTDGERLMFPTYGA